jgi:hypothetical protein
MLKKARKDIYCQNFAELFSFCNFEDYFKKETLSKTTLLFQSYETYHPFGRAAHTRSSQR